MGSYQALIKHNKSVFV